MLPGLEVYAREAFFSHYVSGFSRSHGALADLYRAATPDSPLSAGVDAAALAFLARHRHAPGHAAPLASSPRSADELGRLATAQYVAATRRLGSVLRAEGVCPGGCPASGDETLQAALMLDLYEKLMVAGARGPGGGGGGGGGAASGRGAWMSHARGALALVRAYGLGRDHLASPVRRRLASRLAMALVVSCGAAEIHVPRELEQLLVGLAPYFTMDAAGPSGAGQIGVPTLRLDPKFAVTSAVVGVVNLAGDVGKGGLRSDEACQRAQKLAQCFIEMEQSFPPTWRFTRVGTDEGYPMVYAGYYDIYGDHFITQVRNVVRTMRLLLAKTVIGHRNAGTYADTCGHYCGIPNNYLAIEQLCDEIAASMPQFTWSGARPENRIPFTPLQSLQCFTLLCPLYIAGQLTRRCELRDWIVATLGYMADSGGLPAARTVANVLLDAPETSYWHVYSMIGSYAFAA